MTQEQDFKTEEEYLEWLNSKGHEEVTVTCAECGKEFETMIEKVRKDFALEKDTFFCEECSLKDEEGSGC